MRDAKLPKQDRGRERRNEILDAAARILIELGEKGVSMQAVAMSAGASTGSMYHFFSNRAELMDALFERHMTELVKLMPTYSLDSPEPWRSMSAEEIIDSLFGRVLGYLAQNPDAVFIHSDTRDLSFPHFSTIVAKVLRHRMSSENSEDVAQTLVSVSTGTLRYVANHRQLAPDVIIKRIPDVLTAYLASFETACSMNDA
ncbi:TetR/AcrR family transcriptional regulator [Novosphingobium cyanobacteriorum]|uniref:TetR/AcrR family transcriptional regulator n=1 Tax=Novosphingobium cyanobacteriorum TaxID=3024215 RepID=A0ABT6CNV2_9SPHN|nr:TetR/AcrR family transcriptional regulator [Novosphingobium cyanobacteriorum]MDF8334923.1 TetR/AcrR family transcriptional regulator [Novosphingobium cyanobacteriorum]